MMAQSIPRRPIANSTGGPCPIGMLPSLGMVPRRMHAQVVRRSRYGPPTRAVQQEVLDTPRIAADEVLIAVMAAGINHYSVWAANGAPVDQIAARQRQGEVEDFHIGGSDASGIVYAVGEAVDAIQVGDEVVVHPGQWDPHDPWIESGRDEMIAPSSRIWGYDSNFGSLAQFPRVQAHQVMPKAPHLTWAEAAASTHAGATAYRMLFGWPGNTAAEGDVVLVWGGAGGLGSQAIQLARLAGSQPVAVVSSPEHGSYAMARGAIGWIDRSEFSHWGIPPLIDDRPARREWIIEHPGTSTMSTSAFVCRPGGMVVLCCGTTEFDAAMDLGDHWTGQKRLQGSRGSSDTQAIAYNALVLDGKVDPCVGNIWHFTESEVALSSIARGHETAGNTVVLVGADGPRSGRST